MIDRLIFAAALAAILTLVLGRWGIPFLTRCHVAQRIREEAPTQHRGKAGTPAMGGLLLIPAAVIAAVLAVPQHGWRLLLPLTAMVAYGAVGGLDDALAIRHRRNLGLRARERLGLQVILAGGGGGDAGARARAGKRRHLPGGGGGRIPWAYAIFVILYVL